MAKFKKSITIEKPDECSNCPFHHNDGDDGEICIGGGGSGGTGTEYSYSLSFFIKNTEGKRDKYIQIYGPGDAFVPTYYVEK